MKKEWFEAKSSDGSWRPCCWQGWLVTLIYILLVILIPVLLEKKALDVPDKLLLILITIFLLTVMFIIIAYLKGKKSSH